MVNFRKRLMTAAMVLGVSVSVFAQKGSDNSNKRPPKDPPQVVVKDKEKPPPQSDKKGDKKGKP